jgi:hypothetical protein
MTYHELQQLRELLRKYQSERLDKYRKEGYPVDEMDDEEIIELDDGDNLISGIDTVFTVVCEDLIKVIKESAEG